MLNSSPGKELRGFYDYPEIISFILAIQITELELICKSNALSC